MGRNLTSLPISASFQYLLQKSGSEVNDGLGVDVDYLNISSSHATQADSANTSVTATTANTASYVEGANVDGSVASASFATNAISSSFATSASFATTASFALNVTPIDTGSFMVTGSATDATLTFTKGDASTFDVVVNNVDNSNTASLVETVDGGALSGIHYLPFVDVRTSSGQQLFTDQQLQYNPATDTIEANLDGTSSFATSASHAITADTASFLPADTNLNINSITASNAVFQSASIGFLQTVTGSATIIGDAFVIVNNDTPTQRYAGIKVYDSGSVGVTASLAWDGQTHDWKYEYSSSATHEGGVLLTGPEGTDLGTLPYPTANAIQKGTGTHHLEASNITDDGTLVTIDSNVSASGYISASSFIGDGSSLSNLPEAGLVLGGTATSLQSSLTTTPATASGAGDIAIGDNAITQGGDAISIGKNANDTNKDAQAIAIGTDTEASFSTIALGYRADASNYGMALGAYSINRGGVSVGRSANATGGNATAIGSDATVGGQQGVAIGTQANASNNYSVAIGGLARATGSLSFVIRTNQADLMTATTASQDVTFAGGAHFTDKVTGDVSALSIVSTTASMDCSAGNFFALTLAAGVDTHLDATNLQAGQTINLKITNNAVTAGTISFSPDFEFEGGTPFAASTNTSEVDVLTFISFDAISLQATGLKNFS